MAYFILSLGYGLAIFLLGYAAKVIAGAMAKIIPHPRIAAFVITSITLLVSIPLLQRFAPCFPNCNAQNDGITILAITLFLLVWLDKPSAARAMEKNLNRLIFIATSTFPVVFLVVPPDMQIAMIALNILSRLASMDKWLRKLRSPSQSVQAQANDNG